MIKKYAPLLLSLYYSFRICCLFLFTGLSLVSFAGWQIPIYIIILFCLLFSLIATLSDERFFTSIPYRIRRFLYPIVLLIVLCVLLFRSYEGLQFFSYLRNAFTWLVANLNNSAAYSMEYSLFVIFLLFLLISLLVKFCEKFFKTQLFLSVTILICIILLGTTGIDMSPIALFGGFYYIADTCMTFCLRVLTKDKDVSSYSASLSSVLILMIGFILIIPQSKDPIPYYKIVDAMSSIYYDISGFSQDFLVDFTDHFAGINDGKIDLKGGSVRDNDTVILTIYKNNGNYNPIYLTSNIADYYSGYSWENQITTTEETSEFEKNTEEIITNLQNAGFIKSDPVFHHMSMKIKYQYIYTKNVLYPDNCLSVMDFLPTNTVINKGINIKFKRRPKLDSSYTVNMAEVNLRDPDLLTYINSCPSFSESVQNDPARYDAFLSYLQLPDELPARVKDLAMQITANCNTDYEKIEQIRLYVQQFTYSTEVSNLPDHTDAVDYFLFDQREGYCIHYATTVAVLCRSIGIPSRYVQGVALGAGNRANVWFDALSSSSHAWCEVYLNGYGWLRVDATPIDDITAYYNWPSEDDRKMADMPSNLPPMPYVPDVEEDTTQIDWAAIREKQEQQRIVTLYVALAFTILAIIIVILILINIISKEQKKSLFEKSSVNDQASICLKEILAHLTYLGIIKNAAETMQEFTDRLNKTEPDQYIDTIKVLLVYNNKRYSQTGFNKQDIVAFERSIMLLKSRFIDRYGKFQYFLKTNLKTST